MSFIFPVLVLIALAPCAARAQAASGAGKVRASSSRGGAITGRVVGDDGRPLADAVVQLSKAYGRMAGSPLSANTDAEGKFRVTELEHGLYTVMVLLPGFINAQEARSTGGDEATYYRPGDNVSVTLARGGVITGTVRDAEGDPVVAISVRAIRVRTEAGQPSTAARFQGFIPERMTDDRGVYRIFGLPAGTYVVAAGGGQRLYGAFNAYQGDAATYFPSSTRDTANEVTVRSGEEASGVDIRYRGERGRAVSGSVTGATADAPSYGITVILRRPTSGEFEGITVIGRDNKLSFSFGGVGDGEYELTAQQWRGERGGVLSSIPRRVTVRGADVTGLTLTLAPLASIEGRVRLEPVPADEKCGKPAGVEAVMETAVSARRAEKTRGQESPTQLFFPIVGATPTQQGEFLIRNLLEGNYRLTLRLPAETWYARSIALPGATQAQPGAASKPAATSGAQPAGVFALKMGQTLAGVDIPIAQDGAAITGRVRAAAEGDAPPANLKVQLVPTERERAEDVLRYSEVAPAEDGTFSLTNLAPGRYKLLLRPVPETGSASLRPLAWDAQARAQLRRDAEAATAPPVELKPCQRVTDYELRYVPAAAGKP
ncbi:MAG TPA: carboxypeptidase-like regulatory domain-containing protein [Pyrinomonadaceae bacterium]